jgi:hypothetical protein
MKNNLQKAKAAFFIVVSLFLSSLAQAQGVPGTSVPVNAHCNIASDSYGNVFIADADNNRVLMVNTNGVISNFAGTGAEGYWGDGGPAVSANLNHPSGVAVDASGNVYIADTKNNRIRMVNLQGIIITVVGSGAQGYSGDGSAAVYASLNEPTSVAVDANRNIYIADNYNNRIRMVNSSSGIIYAIAGNGGSAYQQGGAIYQGNNGAMAPVPAPQPVYTPAPVQVTYQSYYDELSPYGQWVNNPRYGNVWVPAAGPDFMPYSSEGHWVYTLYGWTWVSNYSWGWLTFHYGRWDFDNYIGWFWVPGNEWAPAWVSWRSGNGYYGWAPLPPDYGGVSETNTYDIPHERYVFVQNRYIADPNVHSYYVPREQSVTYVTNTTLVNRTYHDNDRGTTHFAGPPKEEVERFSGAPVKEFAVTSSDKPGQTEDRNGGALTIYRPKVEDPKTTAAKGKPVPAPAHVFAKEEVKPIAQREVKTQPRPIAETHEPVKPEEPKKEVVPERTPENTQPNKAVNPTPTPPQNTGAAHPAATTPPNQAAAKPGQPVAAKPGQPAAPIKDKQVAKDAKGHIIYQDPKGVKYYMDEKGKKVIVPPPPAKAPATPPTPSAPGKTN